MSPSRSVLLILLLAQAGCAPPRAPQIAQVGMESEGPSLVIDAQRLFRRLQPAANDSAIRLFEQHLRAHPQDAGAYAGLAEAHAQRFAWNRSSTFLLDSVLVLAQVAEQLDATAAQPHFARAIAYFVAGRIAESAAAAERALELDPSYPRAAAHLAGQLWRLGRYDESFLLGARLRAAEPDNTSVLFNYNVAAQFLGETALADSLMRHAVSVNPRYATGYGELAFIAQGEERHAEAVRWMERAVEADSSHLQRLGLAQMLIGAGDPSRAREMLQTVYHRDPAARGYGGRTVRALYGWALWELGERVTADSVLDAALHELLAREAQGDRSGQLYRQIAGIHAIRGNAEAAVEALRQAAAAGWSAAGGRLVDPMFRSVRSRAEMGPVLGEMRLEQQRQRARVGLPPLNRS